MQPIDEVLNKIKWDPHEHKSDYVICYEDRFAHAIIEVCYTDIQRVEGGFMVLNQQGKETSIPLHRIRIVKKKGDIIWQRTMQNSDSSAD